MQIMKKKLAIHHFFLMGIFSNHRVAVAALVALLLSFNATAQEEGKPLSIDPAGLDQKGRYSPVLQSPTREEVLAYRRKKVVAMQCPGVYPAGYQPADAIYTKNITDNDKWTKSSIFYLSNPQLLVIEASKGRISPFPYWAGGAQDLRAELRCYDKRIEISYGAHESYHWFDYLYYNDHRKNKLRLWLINARDAGFTHAYLDMSRSKNIATSAVKNNIAATVVQSKALYHYGSNVSGNNISPADGRMVVSLKERGEETVLWVKLWRQAPESKDEPEYFAYVIRVSEVDWKIAVEHNWDSVSYYLAPKYWLIFIAIFALYAFVVSALARRLLPPLVTPQPDALRFRFDGDGKTYFKLWAVNLLLTIATVGIYGAWAKVRNRRYIYGNTYLHGSSFDYHANPRSILVARMFVIAIYITLSAAGVRFLLDAGVRDWLEQIFIGLWVDWPVIQAAFSILLLFYAWAFARGMAFNARNSSWRNVRFSFRKKWRLPLYAVLGFLVLSALSSVAPYALIIIGLDSGTVLRGGEMDLAEGWKYTPWKTWFWVWLHYGSYYVMLLLLPILVHLLLVYRAGNHALGNLRFRYIGKLRASYWRFLLVPLPLLILPLAFPFAFYQWGGYYENLLHEWDNLYAFMNTAPFVLALLYALYCAAAMFVLFWRNIVFDGGRVYCAVSTGHYLFHIVLLNFIAILFSLGLLRPWATVRRARYLAARLWVVATPLAEESILAVSPVKAGALGDAAVDGFDFDVALV